MKILNLSLDKSILDKNSKTARRVVEYGDLADSYIVVVPGKDYKEIRLLVKVFIIFARTINKNFFRKPDFFIILARNDNDVTISQIAVFNNSPCCFGIFIQY